MKFNEAQKQAIHHQHGPCCVIAAPGSGKTSVIVERTEYLIRQAKIDPSSILVVTFSRASAREMKERFLARIGKETSPVTFGTFHGIFYGILKHAYGLTGRNILSDEQKQVFLRELMEEYGEEMSEEGEAVVEIAREISLVKGNRVPLEHYYSSSCPDDVFRNIYQGYVRKCRERKLLDFDDMLVSCYELLSKRADILTAWQKKFQYILVDEFQDINQIQYDTLRLLALPENHLFIVGDDDQSIYHFRGARPEIMLNFKKDYPNAKQILLNVNYRCSKEILEMAGRLISHNQNRFPKELRTPNEPGERVRIRCLANLREENRFVLEDIKQYQAEGHALEEVAVLLRTNLEAEGLVGTFLEYNLPFYMKERLPNLFEHWIARDILAYLRLAHGDRSRKYFLEIMNRPNRYLSREAVYEKEVSLETLRKFYEEKDWMCDRIDTLETHLRVLRQLNPFAAINFIRKGIGYEEYLREYAVYRKIKPEELLEVLDRLQETAKGMKDFREWEAYMEDYGRKLKEQAKRQEKTPEGVTISTLHGAKGLEYDRVYILNVNEGSIPYKKAVLETSLEEERRLFYVGMTRARKQLTLCYVIRQFEKEKEISRFIEEANP